MRQSDPAPEPTSQANDGQEDFEPEDSLPF
jgi:hypothetical protein